MIHWHAHSLWFYLTLGLYGISGLAYIGAMIFRRRTPIPELLLGLAMLVNTGEIVSAWIRMGQPPFQTLYQSLVFFAWSVALVYFVARMLAPLRILGMFCALFAFAALIVALVKADLHTVMLPPALQSIWFIPHVIFYFFGYGAMFLSFISALIYLTSSAQRRLKSSYWLGETELDFEVLTYHSVRFGFLMLSIGLVIGVVWAEAAWSAYWSWDPKENWALITWMIYLAYLHLRRLPNWRGRVSAALAIAGFLAVIITYLGVNYLPTIAGALHAYQ